MRLDMEYTVEATTAPVTGGEWDGLRHVLDLVPGTLLIEDPEEPLLIVPVEADEPAKALLFVDGLAKLLGIELRTGRFYPTPQEDFPDDKSGREPESGSVTKTLHDYANQIPQMPVREDGNGKLINC